MSSRAVTAGLSGLSAALVLVAAWAVSVALSGPGGPSSGELVALGAKVDALVADGAWYRVVTATFLHIDAVHLATNAVWVALLGAAAAALLGPARALGVAALSGAAGHLASFAVAAGSSVGASGSVYGLAALVAATAWRRRHRLPADVRWRALASLGAATAVLLLAPLALSGVDHAAHLGGFVAGLTLGALPDARAVGLGTASAAIAIVAVAWLAFALGL